MPNSRTRTLGEAGGHEVAELVDDHEDAEDADEQDDRDERLDEAGHAAAPSGIGRERRADGGIERDQLVEVGVGCAVAAEPLDGRLEQGRDAGEAERAVEEPGDGDLVGRDERGRGPRARAGRPHGRSGGPGSASRRARGSRAARWRAGQAARPATAGGRDRSARTGWEVACQGCPAGPSGSRPRNRTAEWTTLCGWMTTSMAS